MPEIHVDLAAWKMRQYLDWTAAGHALKQPNADAQAAVLTLNRLMATAITVWSFAGAPQDPASYTEALAPWEWRACVEAVDRATQDAFRRSQ